MDEQEPKSNRRVVSIRKSVYDALKHLGEIRAKQIGLSRRIPVTYLIEQMVRREFAALAKAGLTIEVVPENKGAGHECE